MSDLNNNLDFDLEKGYQDSFKYLEENSLVKAIVIDIGGDTVFLDIGGKSEAKLSFSEFDNLPKIGDEVEVYLIRRENRFGDPVVSKKRADTIKEKKLMVKYYKERKILEGEVVEATKGGFVIKYKNIFGFIPFVIFDFNKIEKPEEFLNKKIKFYIERLDFKEKDQRPPRPPRPSKFQKPQGKQIKKIDKEEEEFVGNRRRVLIDENNVLKLKFLEDRKESDLIEGTVKNISDFGAFVDLGGIEALLHIKDISWLRVQKIEDYVKVGSKINVKILNIDKIKGKVSVGLKQTQEEPWEKFARDFKIDDVINGVVTSLTTYGAFVMIIDGVEGLLHISDMAWSKNIKNPAELLKKGQQIEVKIVNIDKENRKINLSLKHLLENPWDKVEEKYKEGTKVKGKIKNIAAFGVFIELEEGIDALLHIDDVSWTETVKNPHKLFKIDDEIEVVIIHCDSKNSKIKVGIKQLAEDPWKKLKDKYNNGDLITCKIDSIDEIKGIGVTVIEDITTYIPVNQIDFGKIDDIKIKMKDFKVGDEVQSLILDINYRRQIIKLSIKEFLKREEKKKVEAFLHDDKEDKKFTLGDMLKSKQQENNDE